MLLEETDERKQEELKAQIRATEERENEKKKKVKISVRLIRLIFATRFVELTSSGARQDWLDAGSAEQA